MQTLLGVLISVVVLSFSIGVFFVGVLFGFFTCKHATDDTEWNFDNAVDYVRYRGEVRILCNEHSGEVVRGDMCEKCIIDAWKSKID